MMIYPDFIASAAANDHLHTHVASVVVLLLPLTPILMAQFNPDYISSSNQYKV